MYIFLIICITLDTEGTFSFPTGSVDGGTCDFPFFFLRGGATGALSATVQILLELAILVLLFALVLAITSGSCSFTEEGSSLD